MTVCAFTAVDSTQFIRKIQQNEPNKYLASRGIEFGHPHTDGDRDRVGSR